MNTFNFLFNLSILGFAFAGIAYLIDEFFTPWYHEKTASSSKTKEMKRYIWVFLNLVAFSIGYFGYLYHFGV